ncbi:hypothetical protein GQ44DRAFT_701348 [Phaeosphaeriaceae sp. PMI808]|nr:hypothetical protein GQ44DRAFT_701348 [Phaeosphaeriaceae sp. PMI808]
MTPRTSLGSGNRCVRKVTPREQHKLECAKDEAVVAPTASYLLISSQVTPVSIYPTYILQSCATACNPRQEWLDAHVDPSHPYTSLRQLALYASIKSINAPPAVSEGSSATSPLFTCFVHKLRPPAFASFAISLFWHTAAPLSFPSFNGLQLTSHSHCVLYLTAFYYSLLASA